MKVWSWRSAIQKSDLQSTTKLVLFNLSVHMSDAGESCFPSTKLQAKSTGLSERSVCTHLDLAEEAGFIETTKHGFGDKKWARNEYKAIYPEGTELGSAPCDEGTEPPSEGTEPDDIKALNVVQSNTTVNSSMNSASSKQQKNKKELFSYDDIQKAKRGDAAWDPEISDVEVLPGGWNDWAENVGVKNADRLFESWRKFKEITSYPYQRKKWQGWLKNEQSYNIID